MQSKPSPHGSEMFRDDQVKVDGAAVYKGKLERRKPDEPFESSVGGF